MPIHILEKLNEGVLVLDLRGRITLGPETESVRRKVTEAVAAHYPWILLDLAGVDYIDSGGLSTLISAYVTARKQGAQLKLVHLTRRVRDLLQITRLSTVFEIFDDLEAARHSFKSTG
jgi:anti-sigma B factor antagonist